MEIIKIHLNNGKEIDVPCSSEHKVYDLHTLARQLSQADLIFCTMYQGRFYRKGRED